MGIEKLNGVASNPQTQNTENVLLYDTKAKRKAAVNQAIKDYMTSGIAKEQNWTEKQTKRAAENLVRNEQYKEEFETFNESTTVYADKKAYKAAKKAQKQAQKEFVKNRAKGVSKEEAKKQFEAKSNKLELAARSARKGFAKLGLVEADGTVGEKAQNFMLKEAQKGNEGETQNYYYQLKERRATKADLKAQGKKVSVHALGKMADATGVHKEKNYSTAIALGAAAGIIATGYGIGYAIGGIGAASASEAATAAAAGNAATGAAAEAAAAGSAAALIGPATIGTALSPFGALGALLKDKGNKIEHITQPGKPQPAPKPEPQPKPEPKPVVEPKPEPKPCPEQNWESEYCDHKVKYGDNWSNVAQGKVRINGKKLDGKMLQAYVHAEKLQHGVTDFKKNTFMNKNENYRLYTDFSNLLENEEIIKKHPELKLLKGAKIELDCDGSYKSEKSTSKTFLKYTGNPLETNKYKQACNDLEPIRVNNK